MKITVKSVFKLVKLTCSDQLLIFNHVVCDQVVFLPNNQSLKYQRFTPLDCKDKGIINLSLWQRLNSFTNLYHAYCIHTTNTCLWLLYFKEHRCESDMKLFNRRITLNYVYYSPLNHENYRFVSCEMLNFAFLFHVIYFTFFHICKI